MIEIASAMPKKAQYRIGELVGNIPVSRLKSEKMALSAQLGVSIPQLNRIIRGDSDPSGTQLRVIADFFGVPVDELYANQDLPDPTLL